MQKEKFIVCCALPYANGPMHIGHLAGCYIPGDVYVRFKRLQGHDVHFVCGTDEHGAAITILAQREGVSPQSIVDKYHQVLKQDLIDCNVEVDVFSRTTHPCHIKRSQEFFLNCYKAGLIERKSEKRLHCEHCHKFLPDRYVVGECPVCHNPGARGDQCEKCGSWFEPEALINPICQICKVTKASLKDTEHWYLSLDKLEPKLKAWLDAKTFWRKSVLGYAYQPLKAELAPRSITRDLDWGVPVPLPEAKDKVLYVWFDAPIGYISASEDWAIQQGKPEAWRNYWEDQNAKLVHFIGKDNIVFHTVVWPAILLGDGRYSLPYLVAGNEFLNLEGEKISTSRNFAIWAGDAVKTIGCDNLRYYLTRISPESSDSNFTWAEFQSKINSELADVFGNLVNRCLSFLNRTFEGRLESSAAAEETARINARAEEALKAYTTNLDLGLSKMASENMLEFARWLNGYFQEAAPWKAAKTDQAKAQAILYATCLGIKALLFMLYPICPGYTQKFWKQLGFSSEFKSLSLARLLEPFPPGHRIAGEVGPVVQKIEDELIGAQKQKLDALLASQR